MSQPKPNTRFRSQEWFDNPANPDMTALYLERYLNFGLTREELQSGKPVIGIAQTGSDLSPCNRPHIELAKRVRRAFEKLAELRLSSRFIQFRKLVNGLLHLWIEILRT